MKITPCPGTANAAMTLYALNRCCLSLAVPVSSMLSSDSGAIMPAPDGTPLRPEQSVKAAYGLPQDEFDVMCVNTLLQACGARLDMSEPLHAAWCSQLIKGFRCISRDEVLQDPYMQNISFSDASCGTPSWGITRTIPESSSCTVHPKTASPDMWCR